MKKDYITDFMELYEIPKVKYQVEGRDVDEEGNIASWYEEEDYPSIEDVFFELLYLANWYDESTVDKIEVRLTSYSLISSLCEFFCGLYLEYVKDSRFEELEKLKKRVQEVFIDTVTETEVEVDADVKRTTEEKTEIEDKVEEPILCNHIEAAFDKSKEDSVSKILRNINKIEELSLEKLTALVYEVVRLEIMKHEELQHRYRNLFSDSNSNTSSFMDCSSPRIHTTINVPNPKDVPNHEVKC